jgi:molecular chaperone DnaK
MVLLGEAGIPALVALATSLSGAPADSVLGGDAVAMGATRLAAEFSGEARGVRLRDIMPWATVCETDEGVRLPLVAANTTLPAKGSATVTTTADDQSSLRIKLLQVREDGDARPVGTFVVDALPVAPSGVPQIEVTVAIDDSGLVGVGARDQRSGDTLPVAATT